MEDARDELERAKIPVHSPSFVAHSSSHTHMPKGIDDYLIRIETLQAAFNRAVARWYDAAFDFEDALNMEMPLTHRKLYQAYFRDGKSLEESAEIAELKLTTVCDIMRKNGFPVELTNKEQKRKRRYHFYESY